VARNGPGQGGVQRGRGDAELHFQGETPGRTDAFEAKELPDAEWLDPESTALLGAGGTTPNVAPLEEGSGRVETQVSSGQAAWKRRLAPHHRDAVQSFFSSSPRK
jgi:hypothetical protein